MKHVSFLFAVHNHQPVGNFESVFESAADRCYAPFLDRLEAHPGVRVALHYSGILLDWFEAHRPLLLDRVGMLAERGQVELLGGGLYEPILISIPERDARGQIEAMRERLKKRFGVAPKGLWLAERVWHPSLPTLLSEAGVRFTLLDDHPFLSAGVPARKLKGHFLAERLGRSVEVFPILKELRYAIPFRTPEEVLEVLHRLAEEEPGSAVTYGDDGEKFGLWPGTFDWVYAKGWLDRFLALLEENASWIWMPRFEEAAETPPTGRIYLPEASYEEMGEWALPPQASLDLWRLKDDLAGEGKLDRARPFLSGGWWENFLAKYPESNDMQKKMLRVSDLVRRAEERNPGNPEAEKIRGDLYQAQCNCAYWHGLFGGIYLNYLRHAVHEHLAKAQVGAEALLGLPPVRLERGDYDVDGLEEVAVETPTFSALIDPAEGGALLDLTYKPKAFTLTNALTRREEAYHSRLHASLAASEGATPDSPHSALKVKEQGLDRFLSYDPYTRRSFLDHVFGFDATLDGYMFTQYTELGDFITGRYDLLEAAEGGEGPLVRLARTGSYWMGRRPVPIRIEKTFRFDPAHAKLSLEIEVKSLSDEEIPLRYGTELNLTLLAGNDPLRYFETPGGRLDPPHLGSSGEVEGLREVSLVDAWAGFRVRLSLDPPGSFWRFPLETVSQSEEGVEKTYQGSSLLFSWMRDLAPRGLLAVRCTLSVEPLNP